MKYLLKLALLITCIFSGFLYSSEEINLVSPVRKTEPTSEYLRPHIPVNCLHGIILGYLGSSWAKSQKLLEHENWVRAVAFSPDGSYLASSAEKINIWQMKKGLAQFSQTLIDSTCDCILSIGFSPNGKYLAAGSYTTLRLWQFKENQFALKHNISIGDAHDTIHPVKSITFSRNGQQMAIFRHHQTIDNHYNDRLSERSLKDRVYVVNLHEDSAQIANSNAFDNPETIKSILFSPDGRHLVSQTNAAIRFWKQTNTLFTYEETIALDHGENGAMAFSPDGAYLLMSFAKSHFPKYFIQVWRYNAQQDRYILEQALPQDSLVNALSFSPDSNFFAVGLEDGIVQIWQYDQHNFKLVNKLEGHEREVLTVAFSRNGYIASGSLDKSVIIWRNQAIELTSDGFVNKITGSAHN